MPSHLSAQEAKKISKFLSLVLRHQPEKIGLELDAQGWTEVAELLQKISEQVFPLDFDTLCEVVENNDKQRFAFNAERSKIRASQGHSVSVELDYAAQQPPEDLYHGTVGRFLAQIRAQGLRKGQRHHVHLSQDRETAARVGARRGQAVILTVRAGAMARAGFEFYCSANGVWLVETVPPEYLSGF